MVPLPRLILSPPALLLSLTASYSPARKLRPRWALTEGPTESFSPSRTGERRSGPGRAMPDADEDARRVRGHLALADRHRGRFLLPFPSPLLPPCSFFLFGYVSTSRRAAGPRALSSRAFVFYSPFVCLRCESPTFLLLSSSCFSRLPRHSPLSLRSAKNPPPRKLTGFTQLIK